MLKEKIEKVKAHLYENRKEYLIGASCMVIGAAISGVVTVIVLKRTGAFSEINMPRFWSPGDNNVMKVIINALGDPGNVVQCVESGTIYASQGQAAKELGIDPSVISKHLRGILPSVKGNHFVILGKAGEVLAE